MFNKNNTLTTSRKFYIVCVLVSLFLCVLINSWRNRVENEEDRCKRGRWQGVVIENGDKDANSSDPNYCGRRAVKLSEKRLTITGLVSFPGSGNTWTRHLIQQMTGLGTSSGYCDCELRNKGFPFECDRRKDRTIVVKTHEDKHFYMFKKLVLLVRNPYDALLSFSNIEKAGHTGHPSKEAVLKASTKMFNHSLWWYLSLTRNVTGKFKGEIHVVQYERLRSDLATELKRLATFLDAHVSDREIDCTVKLQEGHFHRRTSDQEHVALLRTVYSNEKLLRLQRAARTSEKLIKDACNVDIDLGGPVEKILFQNS